MASFSIWHWIILLLVAWIFAYPMAKILQRVGFSGWYALLWLVPLVNIVMLWALAFMKWPSDKPMKSA
jgi:hypothetical protein